MYTGMCVRTHIHNTYTGSGREPVLQVLLVEEKKSRKGVDGKHSGKALEVSIEDLSKPEFSK